MSADNGVTLSNLPVDYQEKLRQQAAEIQKRVSPPTGDKIQVTQQKTFRFPDGTETSQPFEAVIVDFVSMNTFYESGFDKDQITPPDCFAIGLEPTTLVPSGNSPTRQADTCSSCPNNQWGTGARGKGKACKNGRILAVLPPDADKSTTLMLLKLSPTALQGFDQYVTALNSNLGSPPVGVVTTIGFDTKSDYPSVRFGNPRPNDRVAVFMDRQGEARARLLTEPDTSQAKPKTETAPKRRVR